MWFHHHDFAFELPDAWWKEGGFPGPMPASLSYVAGAIEREGALALVPVSDIEPVRRNLSHGVFNDNPDSGTARERVVRLLKGFRHGEPIPPVEILRRPKGAGTPYRLYAGVHRLYCAVAAGFSHVPAVEVGDADA